MTQTLSMRTLVQLFETLHSQITVQSTAANKAKLTFQMIKLKHYHHVPYFFFHPEITTTGLPVQSWQGQSPSMISVQSCWAEGPSWPVPIWSGPSVCSTHAQCTVVITAMVRRRSWWCGYKYKPWSDPSCS